MPDIPRPEYPRPQFVREPWLNLNGVWTGSFDSGRAGMQRGLPASDGFDREILVPFCPESALSGVNYKDFIEMMWYHRRMEIPADWDGKRILLHFGAVDYASEVFVDGQSVGRHWGGTASFCYDITRFVTPGATHNLVVAVQDDVRSGVQPAGKQCPEFKSHGCLYTRTTGIWQTVWLEAAPGYGLKDVTIIPDLDGGRFVITPRFYALRQGLRFRVQVFSEGMLVGEATAPATHGIAYSPPLGHIRPWSPDDPFLYDLVFTVEDVTGIPVDVVNSYAGLRKVHVEGDRLFLNNEALYLRLVLDQGFYPDGIWTAPDDAALKRDIELSLAAGFNGARLHQKVFEERFHYWADKLGYLTWGESSSWGMDIKDIVSARNFLAEWREIVTRDRNHPSIIVWTPFNETHDVGDKRQHHRLHRDAAQLTRDLDPTRPVNDASGYVHVDTDVWTVHTYEQEPDRLLAQLTPDPVQGVFRNFSDHEAPYGGQPYIVDEYGGIKWIPSKERVYADNSWGYGAGPKTEEEFYARLEALTGVLLNLDHVAGFCYTQLTDVEQEQNGIYNYDRSEKFDMARIKRIFQKEKKVPPPGLEPG
ncbi:MAG: beta-glucuronidase [Anaerolineae bacterium]|nr:beta-glucuronidase [Anaerolineae bacterium]